jgi:hypothetical protein
MGRKWADIDSVPIALIRNLFTPGDCLIALLLEPLDVLIRQTFLLIRTDMEIIVGFGSGDKVRFKNEKRENRKTYPKKD